MTTAITHPATISVSIRKQRVDLESTSTLKAIARNLNAIANKETPLRIKLDNSGQLRLKAMPEKLSFLARTFSGIRYAKEGDRASRYFGLPDQATTANALSKTKLLTETLLQPIQKPFTELNRTEASSLYDRLCLLDDKALLQSDENGNIRTARPDTHETLIDNAKIAFSLDERPTVAAVKYLIEQIVPDARLKAELHNLPKFRLIDLQKSLANAYNDDAFILEENHGRISLSKETAPTGEMAMLAIKIRLAIANEVLRRESRATSQTKATAEVAFNLKANRSFKPPKEMSKPENMPAMDVQSPGDEAREAFGVAAAHQDIQAYVTIIESMHQDGSDIAKVIGQISQELCAEKLTVDDAQKYARNELLKLPPEIRTDLTELIIVAHTAYMASL